AHVEPNPAVASFSDIDGHQVNAGPRRQPLGAFKLFNFSAKIDPVPTMLVQNHRQVIPDFYGLTTSFLRSRLKPSVSVLGDEEGAPWVKYIHGDHGKGTWTFFGGHDPEGQQHQIGDPPTDVSLHLHSPGSRPILNNVLFPAAHTRELETAGADLSVAARLHDGGVGFAIVDNEVSDCYVVVECHRPRATTRLDPFDVAGLLAPQGPVARALGGFEDRPSQRDMAAYIA